MTFEAIVRAWAGPLGLALAAMLAGLIAYRISRPVVLRLTRHSRASPGRRRAHGRAAAPDAAARRARCRARRRPRHRAGHRGRPPPRRRAADRRRDVGRGRRGARRRRRGRRAASAGRRRQPPRAPRPHADAGPDAHRQRRADLRRPLVHPDDLPAGTPVRRQPARIGRALGAGDRHRRAFGVRQPDRRPADRAVAADPHRRRAHRRGRMGPRRGDHAAPTWC